VYVRGSHRRRALRHQITPFVGHPAEDVLRVYGADKAVTLLGDAGFGFVEDPFGFHKASVAERTPRLVMDISFGVSTGFAGLFRLRGGWKIRTEVGQLLTVCLSK
jgi:hypothetical protein